MTLLCESQNPPFSQHPMLNMVKLGHLLIVISILATQKSDAYSYQPYVDPNEPAINPTPPKTNPDQPEVNPDLPVIEPKQPETRPDHGGECTDQPCSLPNENSLRFFLLGDWGGLPVWPYVTTAQQHVSNAMAVIGGQQRTHFQLALGDNIYITGVTSPDDSRFQKTFENVYIGSEALYRPWYIIAGNHDHYGDVQAQIDYSKKSSRWIFPDYYYPVRYQLADGLKIDIYMIDTVVLCGNTREGKYKNFYEYLTAPASDRKAQGPKDLEAAERQWHWLDSELAKSDAHYLFVAGHYPVYSVGEHGPTPCLVNRLRPMLQKYKVNAYFSGHDHSLQHINETDHTGHTVHYVVSGSGAFEIKSNKSESLVPANSVSFVYPTKRGWKDVAAKIGLGRGGFVYADVGRHEGRFQYNDGEMNELYSFTLQPRR